MKKLILEMDKNLIENARRQADDSEENLRVAKILKDILG